jgi:hypothetical protein
VAKAGIENKSFIAAVKRCAIQKQGQVEFINKLFSRIRACYSSDSLLFSACEYLMDS